MDKLNKRIREFAEENGLYIMGHYNRDQYAKSMLIERQHTTAFSPRRALPRRIFSQEKSSQIVLMNIFY